MTMVVFKTRGQPAGFKLGRETNPIHTFVVHVIIGIRLWSWPQENSIHDHGGVQDNGVSWL